MKIGILGAGSIGATLTQTLSRAGHDVRVANSRGPDTIDPALLVFGAHPVEAAEVAKDVDVIIASIPLHRVPEIAPLIASVSPDAVLIDTSNYYPTRDSNISAIDEGEVESVWVAQVLGRPIVKAWNAISAESFAAKGMSPGTPGRIAIPVAADRDHDRIVAMQLVDESGFDAFDAGATADSWRQQPASPAYCTDLTLDQMADALAEVDKESLPRLRDLTIAIIKERTQGYANKGDAFGDWLVQLNRAVFI